MSIIRYERRDRRVWTPRSETPHARGPITDYSSHHSLDRSGLIIGQSPGSSLSRRTTCACRQNTEVPQQGTGTYAISHVVYDGPQTYERPITRGHGHGGVEPVVTGLVSSAMQLGNGAVPVLIGSGNFLSWAIAFFVLAIVAALAGFRGIAGLTMEIARLLVLAFIVLAVIALVL